VIFTEVRFIVLIAASWLTFFAAPARYRTTTIALWGIVFYASYAAIFLPLVLGLTLTTWLSGRNAVAWIVGVFVAALLVAFKLNGAAEPLISSAAPSSGVLVPLGFSFLAFELLHVLIERQRGRIESPSAVDVLAFAFFFPARVAGPIKRFPDFIASVSGAEASFDNLYRGTLRVLIGLSKKLLIADVLGLTAAERYYVATSARAWIVVLAYTLQIYFDFSAYSDIAIGFARMLGIRLPENFEMPYFAPNIREFWSRWHITLSNWVRDYVFMPTGRRLFQTRLRRSPVTIAVIAYLLTFIVVGGWHGPTLAFLVWGLYHGVLLSIHHVVRAKMPQRIAVRSMNHARAAHVLNVAFTFLCVAIGWVPFMTDLKSARRLLALMFGMSS
jgi:alginate O-acetyltransferase complex protein AlgI